MGATCACLLLECGAQCFEMKPSLISPMTIRGTGVPAPEDGNPPETHVS